MFRFSRAYQYTDEFESRQAGFDFAEVARTVLKITVETKKALGKWFKAWKPKRPITVFPWEQLCIAFDQVRFLEITP